MLLTALAMLVWERISEENEKPQLNMALIKLQVLRFKNKWENIPFVNLSVIDVAIDISKFSV